MTKEEFITISETAKLMNVSISTLRRWDEKGIFKSEISNGKKHRRYRLSLIHEYLNKVNQKESNSESELIKRYELQIKQNVSLLALGIVNMLSHLQIGIFQKQDYYWEYASRTLHDITAKMGNIKPFPLAIEEQIHLWKIPINDWPFLGFEVIYSDDVYKYDMELVLAEESFAIALAEEATQNNYDRDLEGFIDFLKQCRKTNDEESYTKVRTFFTNYATYKQIRGNKAFLKYSKMGDFLKAILDQFYESIPEDYIYNGKIYICNYCGWTCKKQRDFYQCGSKKCYHYLYRQNKKWSPIEETYSNTMLRIKKAALNCILIPGIPEINLYEKIKKLDIPVNLYPGCDIGDLSVKVNGENWLIDVKDYFAPDYLLKHIRSEESLLYSKPEYDKQFLIIPRIHKKEYMDYVCRKTPQNCAYTVIGEDAFIKLLKKELLDETIHSTNGRQALEKTN